jgi:phospholipid transport system substrate-binding protein
LSGWQRRAVGCRPRAAGLALCAAALLAAAPGGAGRAVDEALRRARAIVVEDRGREEKLLALHALAHELLDTRSMGHRALGRELASRPPEQQEEFLELFDLLMVRAYLQKLLLFRDPEFAVVAEDAGPDGVLVHTKIFTARDEFLVDYQMRRRNERWRASDVVIEGVSLTRNYRSQLHSLLRSHDFEELLERMRRKTRALAEPRGS